jgi:hypothetical protein
MKRQEIYDMWTKFLEDNKQFFLTNEEIWKENLTVVKLYINKYKQLPTHDNTNKQEFKLNCWIRHQKLNYIKRIKTMKNQEIVRLWEEFIKEYSEYFV